MCQECVSHLFFISQGIKTQFNHTSCKSGPKHFLFHLQLFWSKLSHAFWRVTFYWMSIEINVLEKGCHLDNHEHCHPYYQYSYPCMYISQVPANGLCIITIHWALNLRKVVTLTTTWCPWSLNNHNSLADCCSSRKGCNLDNHQGCHLDDNSWITNIILNTYG